MDAIREALGASLEDHRLSRSERRALGALLESVPGEVDRAEIRRLVFAMAAEATADPEVQAVLGWLEDVVKLLHPAPVHPAAGAAEPEAHFSPGHECPMRVIGLLRSVRTHVDVCVFTITDDRIADAILEAHARGVEVRVITDNEKLHDQGSDVPRFMEAGVPLRVDRSEYHMHHKFAIFDRRTLLTGSFNWTRGASEYNEENFVVLGERVLVGKFSERFEKLWEKLGC